MKSFILIVLIIIGLISLLSYIITLTFSAAEPKELLIRLYYSIVLSIIGLVSLGITLHYID